MVETLILLCLSALSPLQDDPARDALRRLQDVLGKAKTVTLRAETEIEVANERVSASSTVLFKDDRVRISGKQKINATEQEFATVVENDKVHVRIEFMAPESFEVPKGYAAELRKLVVVAGVVPTTSALAQSKVARDQCRTPEKFMSISDLKLSDDGKSLRYNLEFKGVNTLDALGGRLACTLRFDPASGKITDRSTVFAAQGIRGTITETYELTLDADIPDSSLKLPERKAPKRETFRPALCWATQCPVDLADAKEGRWMTYRIHATRGDTVYSLRVVGKVDADWLIEAWFETEESKYAWLYQVGPDRRVRKSWVVAEGDAAWTSVPVKEPNPEAPDAPKSEIKVSQEARQVKAGSFDCTRLDVTKPLGNSSLKSTSWVSKDLWAFMPTKDHPGGLVMMESGFATTTLEAKGEDAKPTLPLPKE
ncbi:MAG TPA: hypothetical protein VNM14_09260 [Planctomycetota bacterium]|jgi:hypothetical protein|nr:hypothetical protein [Planctomycetota bacterium]